MKKIFIILIALSFGSCTDLDVEPQDAFGPDELFDNPEAYRSYLAKLYGSFSLTGQDGPDGQGDISIVNDEGFTSYIRAYWKAQELTTDEAVIAWTDAGVRDMHNHSWTSENQFIRVVYYRIFLIIAYCNDFLRQSTSEELNKHNINQQWQDEIAVYRAEARFLRAMAYWHALDLFRNIPLITTISGDLPLQVEPQVIFDFIETELTDIESAMVDPKANEYGRADRAALWMLQAKLYLNAEVYTEEKYFDQCITACKKVIGAGYTLNSDYATLFMADNHTSDEIIFALNSDGENSQNWGSTTFLIHGAIGGTMTDSDYGVSGAWAGMRTTRSMVEKFGADPANPDDPRAIFYTDGQALDIDDIGTFEDGIAVPKFTNLTSEGRQGSNITHSDTDYPLFRLPDAYLMYAEAILRGGQGGDEGEALTLINQMRQRAFGNTSADLLAGELTLDFILDERVRELYWEATRRVDLIRYERFTDNGIWPWKGGVTEGKTTEKFRNIFPIPASDLIANPKLNPNFGY